MLKDEERALSAHANVEQRHTDLARSALYGVMGYLGISVMTDEAVDSIASRIADWELEHLARIQAEARLEEAKWWNETRGDQIHTTGELQRQRLTALKALAGGEKT